MFSLLVSILCMLVCVSLVNKPLALEFEFPDKTLDPTMDGTNMLELVKAQNCLFMKQKQQFCRLDVILEQLLEWLCQESFWGVGSPLPCRGPSRGCLPTSLPHRGCRSSSWLCRGHLCLSLVTRPLGSAKESLHPPAMLRMSLNCLALLRTSLHFLALVMSLCLPTPLRISLLPLALQCT